MDGDVKKTAILVAGMHRSGTSAISRILNLLGCALPKTMDTAGPDNPRGFWESLAIRDLNDRILASAGSAWDDWEPFDPRWYASPVVEEFRDRARATLAEEFGDCRFFVLKDPRICRLLPFWVDSLNGIGATSYIVTPIRNPLDVAMSLEARKRDRPIHRTSSLATARPGCRRGHPSSEARVSALRTPDLRAPRRCRRDE